MSQSARIFTIACPKPAVLLEDCQREYGAPPLHKDPGIQCRCRSHPPVQCRDLGSLPKADQATAVVLPTLLRSILGIKREDHVSNEEVLNRGLPAQHRVHPASVAVRWAGHVTRMEDVRMPKAVFFRELQEGKRDRGAARKRCTNGNQPSGMAAGGLRPR